VRSDKLIPLDRRDPPKNYGNDAVREEIARQTEEFLARGGTIKKYGSDSTPNRGVELYTDIQARDRDAYRRRVQGIVINPEKAAQTGGANDN